MKIKQADIAWVAGLLEGEGCFLRRNAGTAKNVLVACQMTDLDVLQKLLNFITVGYINGPYKNGNIKNKPRYSYRLAGEDAYSLMKLLLPLMGRRRKNKIRELIKGYESVKPKIFKILNLRTKKIDSTINIFAWCKKNKILYNSICQTRYRRGSCFGWKMLS